MYVRERRNPRRQNVADSTDELVTNFTCRNAQGRRAYYWAFFKTTETHKEGNVEMETLQCILCEKTPAKSSGRKYGQFAYNTLNGTSNLDKHVKKSHADVFEVLTSELNRLGYENAARAKKRQNELSFLNEDRIEESQMGKYPHDKPKQARFNSHCALLATQGLLPFSFVENSSFRKLVKNLDPQIRQMSRKELTSVQIPNLCREINEGYVQPLIKSCVGGALQFDIWMSRSNQDVFSIVFTTVDESWHQHALNLGLLVVEKSDGNSLSEDLIRIIHANGIEDKIIAIVKDQGSNLIKATRLLQGEVKTPIKDVPLLHVDCMAHALNKVCKNAMKSNALIKKAMAEVTNCVRFTKKSTIASRLLQEAQVKCNLPKKKLVSHVATRFASYLASFKSFLDNEAAIRLMFSSNTIANLQDRLPSPLSWNIIRLINGMMGKVVACLFQTQGRMLMSDAVVALISLFTEFKSGFYEEFLNSIESDPIANEVLSEEFVLVKTVAEDITQATCSSLLEFLSPFGVFSLEKSHVWICMMLDPRYKRLRAARQLEKDFPSLFAVKSINKNYEDVLFKALLSMHNLLYSTNEDLQESRNNCTSSEDDDNDDFLEYQDTYLIGSDEFVVVRSEFIRFRNVPVLASDQCAFKWWRDNGYRFPTVAMLARLMLAIPSSQCECERTFSTAGILSQNRRNNLSVESMDSVIKINKNLVNFDKLQSTQFSTLDDFVTKEIEILNSFDFIDDAHDNSAEHL